METWNVVGRINRVTPANKLPCGEEGGWTAESPPRSFRPLIGPLRERRERRKKLPAWTSFRAPRSVGEEELIKLQVAFDSRGFAIYVGIVDVVKPVVRLYPLPFSGFTLRRINGANCTINRRFPPHHPGTECTPRTRAARDKKVVNSFMDSGGRGGRVDSARFRE